VIDTLKIGLFLMAAIPLSYGHAAETDLYRTSVIVTGQGKTNRELGFKECFDRIVARVTGDPRLSSRAETEPFREDAGRLVASFSYRDRMGGIPIHDEQGTYDRPHDLTCVFDPATLDPVLKQLGSRPWISQRLPISVFLLVERGTDRTVLLEGTSKGADMRESFAAAARTMAMEVRFPAKGELDIETWRLLAEPDSQRAARSTNRYVTGTASLIGRLVWSEDDLGWVVAWTLPYDDQYYRWQVRGINFDEAFRVAVRGVAQILSGNGEPEQSSTAPPKP
jgi:hypothetical protein